MSKEVLAEKVMIYDSSQGGKELFHESLMSCPQRSALAPWAHDDIPRVVEEAKVRGIMVDRLSIQLQDAVKTGVVSAEEVEDYQGVIAEFPWRVDGRFVRLPEHELFYKVAFSRNRCAIGEVTQKKLQKTEIAIIGLGVGTACGYLLGLSGAENFRVCDGGVEDLHDHNRLLGADVANIGLNQAIRWSRMMYLLNPFIKIDGYPVNIGQTSEDGVDLKTFLKGADIVIEAVDSLPVKLAVREETKNLDIPVLMGTDLGFAGLCQLETKETPVFQGRFTEVLRNQLLDPGIDIRVKTNLAAQVIVGLDNIPEQYMAALQTAQQESLSYWPQLGTSAFISAGLVTTAVLKLLQGEGVRNETGVDFWQILT